MSKMSIKTYCETHGLNYNTVMNRMKLGWSLEEALKKEVRKDYEIDGMSLHAYCKKHGLNYATINSRIKQFGYSIEEAVSKPVAKKKNPKMMYGEVSLREYCITNEISYDLVRKRIQNGWDIEKAINTEVRKGKYPDGHNLIS